MPLNKNIGFMPKGDFHGYPKALKTVQSQYTNQIPFLRRN